MFYRVIVFRVSREFLSEINEFCKREKISYSELFHKAIEHLCKKYLGGDNEKRESSGRKNRVSGQNDNVSKTSEDSPNAREDKI
jgi:metal-responsive CopG/Arc/MetJ family transcriptional regulator